MKLSSVFAAARNLESRRSPPSARRATSALFAVTSVKLNAGLLLFRRREGQLEVLLAHQGGPLFASKDFGVWSLPKTEVSEGEGPLAAARRAFTEKLGRPAPAGPVHELGCVNHRSGTVVHGWAVESDFDPNMLSGATFVLEWPPASGRHESFACIDRVAWFDVETARRKLTSAQMPLLQRLINAQAPRR